MPNHPFRSITVGQPTHPAHNSEHIVVAGIDAHLRGVDSRHRGIGEDKLEGRVINA